MANGQEGATKQVKCLVCGAIFDADLDVCPVCGVGKEHFVEIEETKQGYKKNTRDFYLILGNGTAGLSAAKAIRDRDQTGTIVMISKEPYSTYNRPMLTKSMIDDMKPEQIAVESDTWYQDNKVVQVLNTEVAAIHPTEKEVELSDGKRMKYTKLIYALGAECFVPPIQGSEKEQVVAIRRIDDVKKIAQLLPQTNQVVVIGGGVLGLEAAWTLKSAGKEVTVLELAPTLMGRQLDDKAGNLLKEIASEQGIHIHTGVQIEAITGESAVEGVKLSDGQLFPAQLVIVSAGVRANTDIAKAAGIAVDRAIIVNDKMETNVSDIYACGDCAQYEGVNYAIWPEATMQGETAGANAVGDVVKYIGSTAGLSFHGMNTALFAIGDNGKDASKDYQTIELYDEGKKEYKKFYFTEDQICGCILIGDVSSMGAVTEAVEQHATIDTVKQQLGVS